MHQHVTRSAVKQLEHKLELQQKETARKLQEIAFLNEKVKQMENDVTIIKQKCEDMENRAYTAEGKYVIASKLVTAAVV